MSNPDRAVLRTKVRLQQRSVGKQLHVGAVVHADNATGRSHPAVWNLCDFWHEWVSRVRAEARGYLGLGNKGSVHLNFRIEIRSPAVVAAALLLSLSASAFASDAFRADWVEPSFPFFSSVVDARGQVEGGLEDNLTPRGIVLNLGRDAWACFDIDLLRLAVVWNGQGLTAKALAPGSYRNPTQSTPGGQTPAPEPIGNIWLSNGIYPGWQLGSAPSFHDPREPAPSTEEVGRGPLPEAVGRFRAVRLVRGGAVLEYSVGIMNVRELMTPSESGGRLMIERHFELEPSDDAMLLLLGRKSNGPSSYRTSISLGLPEGKPVAEILPDAAVWVVRVPAHKTSLRFSVRMARGDAAPPSVPLTIPSAARSPLWPEEIVTKTKRSSKEGPYVVDDFELPLANPWHRDVRLGDIQFLADGTGVGVTLDGDVWKIWGLHDSSGVVRWKRFSSGLHEPMSLAIRNNEIYVFDRNGIWCLRDTNGDGEADVHELFSNAFAQTADMREFPSALRVAPNGEFVIAKGGQQATTLGKHNGSVLRVSADGRRATVLGYGFRQPNIGVNIRTGLVTACDQQGQYVPATPLFIVRDHQFHGFLSILEPREQYPEKIADPLTWIPHAVNGSGISQVWLLGARMGALNDSLVHVGFNKPELFRVMLNERDKKPQAAVVSITQSFDFPPLSGSVNPADGQLYLAGFQILGWGTTANRVSGLARVRYTGADCTLPREVVPMDKGLLLRFDVALDPKKALDPNSYAIATWHYRRTYKYGSPQLKADGTPGMDWLVASSAYLAKDRRSVFLGVPDIQPVMQMRVGWSLTTASGENFSENAYLTPYRLAKFDPRSEGFGEISVDLTLRSAAVRSSEPVNVDEGRRLYKIMGCVACHLTDGTSHASIGPTWKGLFGKPRALAKGGSVLADESYLRESILDPSAKLAAGFTRGEYAMPSYAGVLTDAQIESLILFIKSLQ